MEQKFCQSCGMPLNPANPGTNADGSISVKIIVVTVTRMEYSYKTSI